MPAKKTEITIGFTPHFPSFVEKELPLMEKADLILVELPQEYIRELSKGTSPKELAWRTNFPETVEKQLTQIKKLMDAGKSVLGYEVWHDPSMWTPRELKKVEKIQDEMGVEKRKQMFFPSSSRSRQLIAEAAKFREDKSLKIIKGIIPKFGGKKVYISAGQAHTRIFHGLKKLSEKNVTVRAEFFDRGKVIPSAVIFSPEVEEMRMYTFGIAKKNPEKMKRLEKQADDFSMDKASLQMKYMRMGLTQEQAAERAKYETLKEWVPKRRLRR